ncbi:hypothetical protein PCANC_17027 [Puccinia coronata f. sp. avenae]|uniref:Uncharacterized protein n=1 Tax=Puccinia coronata f. sp. avenae TaxID=200324 RepID=A0A2N5SP00_9BASI|nr:hypothetical protein PCANC_17027 [Puccinia coronata f. sp. avenae]
MSRELGSNGLLQTVATKRSPASGVRLEVGTDRETQRTAVNSARKARRCSSLSPPLLPAAPSPLGAGSVSRPIASPVSDVCLALLPTVASQLGLGSLRIPNIFANSPSLPWAVLPWIYLPSSLAHRNP